MGGPQQDFVFLGTPLEELDQDEIPRKKFQPDLTVRDAQGRRRFHGAFTGGFSAGFYNTVGTKEGWTPSTFKSSKSNKSENAVLGPEDFMDEEDLGEFGIAPKKIQVKEDFVDFSEQRKRVRDPPRINRGPIPGSPPLKNLFKPVSQSIGVKLLNCMGWRQGQGIGPRLKKKRKEIKEKNEGKVYGCALPPDSSDEDDNLYAPADIDEITYKPKDNLHGIGYVSLDRHSVLCAPIDIDQPTTARGHLEKGKRKIAITGQAFGVGAFEEDDGDIYAREDMSQYDFVLGEETEDKPRKSLPAIEGPKHKSLHHITKTLEGFHLAKEPPAVRKLYPPPVIPPDFEPIHRAAKKERRRFEEPKGDLCKEEKAEHSGSIFDLISPADKARIENIKKGGHADHAKDTPTGVHDQIQHPKAVPVRDDAPSWETLQEEPAGPMKPFARDEAKQKRFEQYLSLLNSNRLEVFPAMQPLHMTEWEKEREAKEFQRAAAICQPTRSLSSRFVSTRTLKEDDSVDVPVDKVEETRDAAKAAQLGMFGKLTHEDFEWHPADLLCRRFNIPNPYPNCEKVGLATVKKDSRSIFNFLELPTEESDVKDKSEGAAKVDASEALQLEKPSSSGMQPAIQSQESSMEQDVEEGGEPEEERPSREFFKSIFSDSSSDDETGDKAERPSKEQAPEVKSTEKPKSTEDVLGRDSDVDLVIKKPSRPALGVFANLDFDRLNQRPPAVPVEELEPKRPQDTVDSKKDSTPSQAATVDDSNLYGPKPPPPGAYSTVQLSPQTSKGHHSHRQKESHISKPEEKNKKHKSKSKKKKKHKKHAKKLSKLKRSSKNDSSEDSTDSDEDLRGTIEEPSYKDIMTRLEKLRKHM